MKKILLAYLLCSSIISIGQVNTDSLFQVWNSPNYPDTTRLDAIHSVIGNKYLFSQPDTAFSYAQLQFNFAKKRGLKRQMASALNTQAIVLSLQGNYRESIIFNNKSLKIREEIKDQSGIAMSLNNIGAIYLDQEDYTTAIKYFTKSVNLKIKSKNKYGTANSYLNIGEAYEHKNNLTKAIKYYKSGLKIYTEINYKNGIANSLTSLGNAYSAQKNYTQAIEYVNQALKLLEETESERLLGNTLLSMGSLYNSIGDSASQIKNIPLAKSMYLKSYYYYTKVLTITKKIETVNQIRDASMGLYTFYKRNGNYKKSLEMHELYVNTKDSINNIEAQRQVIRQEFEYQYEKQVAIDKVAYLKQQKLDALTLQYERYIIAGGFVLLLILVSVFLRIRFIKRLAEKKLLLQEIKLLKTETVIKKAVNSSESNKQFELDKSKIEISIGASLNQSDWKILTTLYLNPVISNKEISAQVFLSIAGVRSSLGKLYRLFDIQKTNENQRISLVIKATKISKGILLQE
ncbi:MAG: tetratricopeptide repeat protein [Flavobacteriales bacterium]|nr:tetratricopeptide repeat protein [Flavobacteriales bacterium]